MKLKFNYIFLALFAIILIISTDCRKKVRKGPIVDPLAIHIALGQTQQQTQGYLNHNISDFLEKHKEFDKIHFQRLYI